MFSLPKFTHEAEDSMKKKLTAYLLAAILTVATIGFVGCAPQNDYSEEIDESRTQIYVYNFYSGFGADWLVSAKRQFETLYADYKGVNADGSENGKVGVQIIMDNKKDYFNSTGSIKNNANEVFFTEYTYMYNIKSDNTLLDITDWLTTPWVNAPSAEYRDARTVAEKMNAVQRAYYTANYDGSTETGESTNGYTVANDDRRYLAVPHYEAYEGIVYNIDLWNKYGFYFSESGKTLDRDTQMHDGIFTDDLTDRTAGPDGIAGTSDDGMPATYEDFYYLCDFIVQNQCSPIKWSGEHYDTYVGGLYNALVADYDGDDMRLSYTLNGTAKTLVESDGVTPLADQSITPDTARKIANLKGRYEALKFIERLVRTSDWHAPDAFNNSDSHLDAQTTFLRSEYASDIKPIAMLVDGTWWESEATGAFEQIARDIPGAKPKAERNFGWLPLPKADASRIGKQTHFDPIQGVTFVNANVPTEKKYIIEQFVRFMYSDKMLSEFTRITSAVKALDYTINESDKSQMSTFATNLWKSREEAKEVLYPICNERLFAGNTASFGRNYLMCVEYGGTTYNYCTQAYKQNKSLTALQAFQGMITYQAGWASGLKK